MVSTIPIEVQERILACLHGDMSTLKACAFVCQAWRPTTRSYLHRRFTALYEIGREQDDPAWDACRISTYAAQVLHLARYIREIDIQDEQGSLLDVPELEALGVILDQTNSLDRLSISTFRGGFAMRPTFRDSLSAAVQRSSSSLTHIFVHGFSLAVSDIQMFRGMRCLQYVGLERIGVLLDDKEVITPAWISNVESPQLGNIQTLTLNFNFSAPINGLFITGLIKALDGVDVLHLTNLRLGSVNPSILEALPPALLSNLTQLGLELTNLNPSHPFYPLSTAFIAKVPTFHAIQVLELSLIVYPSIIPHDLSALESFMDKLLPVHRLRSVITSVTAYGPPVYIDAVRRHYDYCVSRAEVVKIRWENGNLDDLQVTFPEFFANGTMHVGKFHRDKWIGW
ncbi:hypothetical protein MSAN_02208700 [Mycena sanguinolenta]|uniref:F-box domain-containing protein n=1 Tax=Mycena sanguinolenta TaxID=230812 RepID=A0A8H6XE35_9AGAR|nr:hypothetical protein MSAN_02208700 [Mycena sanguinolenta]